MRDPSGAFYTARDDDSEGVEGIFYTWKRSELVAVLGQEAGELFCKVYGVTEEGNFEGASILFLPQELPKLAEEMGIVEDDLLSKLNESKAKLLTLRGERVWPIPAEKARRVWNARQRGG